MNTYFVRVWVLGCTVLALDLTVRADTEREAEVIGVRRGLRCGSLLAVNVRLLDC